MTSYNSANPFAQPKTPDDYKKQIDSIWSAITNTIGVSGVAEKTNVDDVVNAFLSRNSLPHALKPKFQNILKNIGKFANSEINASNTNSARIELESLNSILKANGIGPRAFDLDQKEWYAFNIAVNPEAAQRPAADKQKTTQRTQSEQNIQLTTTEPPNIQKAPASPIFPPTSTDYSAKQNAEEKAKQERLAQNKDEDEKAKKDAMEQAKIREEQNITDRKKFLEDLQQLTGSNSNNLVTLAKDALKKSKVGLFASPETEVARAIQDKKTAKHLDSPDKSKKFGDDPLAPKMQTEIQKTTSSHMLPLQELRVNSVNLSTRDSATQSTTESGTQSIDSSSQLSEQHSTQQSYLEQLQAEVKKHPDAQVSHSVSIPQGKNNEVTNMQSLAVKASEERGPLHDASGFIKQTDGTYKLNNPGQLDGPIFMSRIDANGKQVKDKDGKPVYDVLVFDPKGHLNNAKSFIAPEDCPPGSKSTIDPALQKEYVKTHHDLYANRIKQQAVSVVGSIQIEAQHTSPPPPPSFRLNAATKNPGRI